MVGNRTGAPEEHASREKLVPSWHFTIYGLAIVAAALLVMLGVELIDPVTPRSSPDLWPMQQAGSDGGAG